MDFQKTENKWINEYKWIQMNTNEYKYHSNIVMIDNKIEPESIFSFTTVQYEDILRKTKNLNVS